LKRGRALSTDSSGLDHYSKNNANDKESENSHNISLFLYERITNGLEIGRLPGNPGALAEVLAHLPKTEIGTIILATYERFVHMRYCAHWIVYIIRSKKIRKGSHLNI